MELMANMNSRLFDALPALLTEEISANSDFDGKALAASSLGVSLMRGMWQAITSSFSALRGQYTRLGQLLGAFDANESSMQCSAVSHKHDNILNSIYMF